MTLVLLFMNLLAGHDDFQAASPKRRPGNLWVSGTFRIAAGT